MRIGLIAMSGLRACDPELIAHGLTLPGFIERGKTIASLPSLGLLTVAGLTPAEHTCDYFEIDDLRTAGEIPDGFDLVAISSLSAQIDEAYQLADIYRTRGTPVVMGGLHVTSVPDEAALHCDAVVVGEGEPVWKDVLHDADAGRLKSRYGPGGDYALGETRLPAFDLLDPDKYNRLTVQTSRGCPFQCEFCASSILLTRRYKQKPVDVVLAEIDRIREIWRRPFIEFADAVATVIVWFTPMPILNIMGGIRLTASEQIIQSALMFVRFFGAVTMLLWFGGTITIACHHDRGTSTWRLIDLASEGPSRVSPGLWLLAAVALVVSAPILPRTQPEQIHERAVELQLRRGPMSETVEILSQYTRDDFPPHWDPPPRFGYADHEPPFLDLLELLATADIDPEVRAVFSEKLFGKTYVYPYTAEFENRYAHRLENSTDEDLARLISLLKSIPEGPRIALYFHRELGELLTEGDSLPDGRPRPELPANRRALLESLDRIAPPAPGKTRDHETQ